VVGCTDRASLERLHTVSSPTSSSCAEACPSKEPDRSSYSHSSSLMGMTPECFPLPVDNITLLRSEIAPSWVSGPSIRGTSDILYSCILTLFLCVWTSIHLDIAPGRKSWENLFNRFFFMLLAMVFPELVLFYAFNEWSSVRQLCKSLNEAAKQHKSKVSLPSGGIPRTYFS